MPTWVGIEDGSAQASKVWLARQGDHQQQQEDWWKPLRKLDCEALNVSPEKPIYIEEGRCTADPVSGIVFYNFFRGHQRQLCSAIWFLREETSNKDFRLVPITNDTDSAAIEALYRAAVQATSSLGKGIASVLDQRVDLEQGNAKVKVVQTGNTLTMKQFPSNSWFIGGGQDLQRGYGPYVVEGEEDETVLGPVRHPVFVVHGIGEAFFARDDVKIPSLINQMNATRIHVQQKQVLLWKIACQKAKKTGQALPHPPNRIEFIPIEWFNRLHDSSTALMKSLKATTLQSIPALRAIANDVIFDVLMYLTPNFCESVLECVTTQVNELYGAFAKVHPGFLPHGGKCSFIGHSLGSVIVWDLLSILKDRDEAKAGTTASMNTQGVAIASPEKGGSDLGYQAYAKETGANQACNGTWGPSLTKPMTRTIPFIPECTVFLGSPLGMFLTLRGAHAVFDELRDVAIKQATHRVGEGKSGNDEHVDVPVTSPFSLPTGRLYNIFNPSDPVAYRIEPLLLPQDLDSAELPAPRYLTAPGKDLKFHVKAKQITDDLRKSIMDQKMVWGSLIESAVSALSTDVATTKAAGLAKPHIHGGALNFPLGGKSDRVDYSFQPAVIDNEYISSVLAHSTATYFGNSDLQEFLLTVMSEDEQHHGSLAALEEAKGNTDHAPKS
jgi:hypothetical protein